MSEVELYGYGMLAALLGAGLIAAVAIIRGKLGPNKRPSMAHCQVCGRGLRIGRYVQCLREGPRFYPFKNPAGQRFEQSVRWLCGACAQRAERHRATETIEV